MYTFKCSVLTYSTACNFLLSLHCVFSDVNSTVYENTVVIVKFLKLAGTFLNLCSCRFAFVKTSYIEVKSLSAHKSLHILKKKTQSDANLNIFITIQ